MSPIKVFCCCQPVLSSSVIVELCLPHALFPCIEKWGDVKTPCNTAPLCLAVTKFHAPTSLTVSEEELCSIASSLFSFPRLPRLPLSLIRCSCTLQDEDVVPSNYWRKFLALSRQHLSQSPIRKISLRILEVWLSELTIEDSSPLVITQTHEDYSMIWKKLLFRGQRRENQLSYTYSLGFSKSIGSVPSHKHRRM